MLEKVPAAIQPGGAPKGPRKGKVADVITQLGFCYPGQRRLEEASAWPGCPALLHREAGRRPRRTSLENSLESWAFPQEAPFDNTSPVDAGLSPYASVLSLSLKGAAISTLKSRKMYPQQDDVFSALAFGYFIALPLHALPAMPPASRPQPCPGLHPDLLPGQAALAFSHQEVPALPLSLDAAH